VKMKKILFFGLLIFLVFSLGCKESCESGLYTDDGKCCNYICEFGCDEGYQYKEGTCNCQCELIPIDDVGINLDDLFDDGSDVEPPVPPI